MAGVDHVWVELREGPGDHDLLEFVDAFLATTAGSAEGAQRSSENSTTTGSFGSGTKGAVTRARGNG